MIEIQIQKPMLHNLVGKTGNKKKDSCKNYRAQQGNAHLNEIPNFDSDPEDRKTVASGSLAAQVSISYSFPAHLSKL